MGTPEFACPALGALVNAGEYDIKAVLTQPDKPAGRGNKLTPPPIKLLAEKLGLNVFQPKSLKGYQPKIQYDAFIAVAYGKIIPKELLQSPRCGIINIHPSLLPRWRGAAPIQHALFAGDKVTGTSIMQIDEGLDTGPVYKTVEMPIDDTDDFGSLHDKLKIQGAELLLEILPQILNGNLSPTSQQTSGETYAQKWDKEDLQINWQEHADITLRRIRTCSPHQGARTNLEGNAVKIFKAHDVANQNFPDKGPGEIVELNKGELIVTAGEACYIAIDEMQFPGKKRLPISEILKGHQLTIGNKFT